MKYCCAILILLFGLRAFANEVIPPTPDRYFNDYANVVSPSTASQLNTTLENFERESSDQILVAIYPKMQSDSSIDDYAVRVARAWQAGLKDKNNGAVLFIFVQDRSMTLQTGYGLEGALPDALCKRIIDEQIAPRFKTGDYDGGCIAGVQSIVAAVKGEYQGTGGTVNHDKYLAIQRHNQKIGEILSCFILALFVLVAISGARRRGGWGGGSGMIFTSGGWGGYSGGGGWGGGGSSGGGGFSGGFSGGGGSFGGGGASGHW